MRSTLLLSNITCIDHAFIDRSGMPVGGSYLASFLVTGEVESEENVVVDFSKIKRSIKASVDDKISGFDHKLWLDLDSVVVFSLDEEKGRIEFETPQIRASLPLDAVKLMQIESYLDKSTLESVIAAKVAQDLNAQYKDLSITVTCYLKEEADVTFTGPIAYFRYTHGLKSSSSRGCTNVLHGHLSYIQALIDAEIYEETLDELLVLLSVISEDLDTMFIFKDNIVSTDNGTTRLKYTTEERGLFELSTSPKVNTTVLETETTVEHLAFFVEAKYGEQLKNLGAKAFVISEGLQKGSFVEL
jgi:6-pyruvoyl-tetrahydropterin synthase